MIAVEAFEHWCEVCGTSAVLTPDEAYSAGWDFPPRMGEFGVVSPRTCGSCAMKDTVWWALACEGKDVADLSPDQCKALARILNEAP